MISVVDSLTVPAAGVDTWSPSWYITGRKFADSVASVARVGGPAGAMMLEDLVLDHRVGYFPGTGLLFAEGHPALNGLAPGDELPDRMVALEGALSDYGLGMAGTKRAGLRRVDTTVDLRFDNPIAGLATMAALAGMQFPRCKLQCEYEVGGSRIETITLKGRAGRKTVGRMYDKGVQTKSAARGEWNRFEDQRRFNKSNRWDVSELSGKRVHDAFKSRFVPLWTATKGVTVAGPLIIAETLAKKIESGEVTASEAIRIAGYTMLTTTGVELGSRRTGYRRRAEARKAGIYADLLLDDAVASVEVDVSAVLEAALDAPAWGVG